MENKVLAVHLDLKEDSKDAVVSGEAVVLDGDTKVFLNVSWDSALADELSIEVNDSSISRIITSDSPDAAAILLMKRRTGIMFDSTDAALGSKYGAICRQLITLISSVVRNITSFKDGKPQWVMPAA